jgi:hypothetical protein
MQRAGGRGTASAAIAKGLDGLANDRVLYSGNSPPQPVVDALRRAVAETCPAAARCANRTPSGGSAVDARHGPPLAQGGEERTPLALLGCGDYASTEMLPRSCATDASRPG